MDHDKTTLIGEIKDLESELSLAKQATKTAQEHYESVRTQLLDAQQTATHQCKIHFQERMAQIKALRQSISQTHFDTQQQLNQLRQALSTTYNKLYQG